MLPWLPQGGHIWSAYRSTPEVGMVTQLHFKPTRLIKAGSKETLGFFKNELFTSAGQDHSQRRRANCQSFLFWGKIFFFIQNPSYKMSTIYYFLIRIKHVCAKSPQSCPTLCNPMDCSPPGFSVHETLQARTLEWIAMPSSRGHSQPRDLTSVSYVYCVGR